MNGFTFWTFVVHFNRVTGHPLLFFVAAAGTLNCRNYFDPFNHCGFHFKIKTGKKFLCFY
jgi:hypothetical protein